MGALCSGFPPGAHLIFEVASVTRQEQSRAPLPDRNRLHLVTRGPKSALDPSQGRSLGGRQAGQSRTCLKNVLRGTPPEPSLLCRLRGGGPVLGNPPPTSSHQELGLPATQVPSGQHHPHPQDPVGTLESRRGRMLRAGGPRPERGWGGGNQKREDPALPGAGPFSGCCLPRAARVRVPQVPTGFPCREGGFSFLKRSRVTLASR